MSICEIKHYDEPFEVTEAVANAIRKKGDIFKAVTKTKKNIQYVLISASGVKPNDHSRSLLSKTVGLDDLFIARFLIAAVAPISIMHDNVQTLSRV